MNSFFKRLAPFVSAGLFAAPHLLAQAPLENALFAAATVTRDAQDRDWAYVVLQFTGSSGALLDRRYTVYAKPGDPGDPGIFERTGNLALQIDPKIIKVFLDRASGFSETPANLDSAINELFADLVPDPNLPLEEKLSAVIRGSLEREADLDNLLLLARLHPGISLALGLAHAQVIPEGRTTLEIRELDAANRELGVVARVTVEAGQPVVLTAPGAPVNVPEISPKGHLNVRFRWATPDDLRRLSLLQYGFNVYRVDKDFAENMDWHNTPPPQGLLGELAPTQPEITRVNRAPLLTDIDLTPPEAQDLNADPATFFIVDDNGISQPGADPFVEGERFYYYVAARDILGRDGAYSPGTEAVIIDRIPAYAPRRPEVTNITRLIDGEEHQHLEITWRQNDRPGESIHGYFVYRWNNPEDVQRFAANPNFNRVSALIPHLPGETHQRFIDHGEGAPTAPEAFDKTYWYTVRAVKLSIASNLSPNSAPAFGVLRNRFAPEAPEGLVFINCPRPVAEDNRVEDLASPSADDPTELLLDLIALRNTERIAWAEFGMGHDGLRDEPVVPLGRFYYLFKRPGVRTRLTLPRFPTINEPVRIYCRVGDAAGRVSDWVWLEERDDPALGVVRRYFFDAFSVDEEVLLDENAIANGCFAHTPGGVAFPGGLGNPPGDNGEHPQPPIKLEFELTERAEEYRLFRRIDEGNLVLWRQGLADEAEANTIIQKDKSFPPNAGEISYFGQLLDDNGNASELKLLAHVMLAQPAPQPMLAMPEAEGTLSDPRMRIRWFSPPHGVERFAVILGVEPGPVPAFISDQLSQNTAIDDGMVPNIPNIDLNLDVDKMPNTKIVGIYETPSLDSGFGPGPEYELSIPVIPGKTYSVQVRAVAKAGGVFRYSVPYEFVWPTEDPADLEGPDVPWPARPMPAVGESFSNNVQAMRVNLPGDFNGLGVVIGVIPPALVNPEGQLVSEETNYNFFLAVDQNDPNRRISPFMLYRYQVPSAAFPAPSGDILQVSPLIRNIASRPFNGIRELRDPFIRVLPPDPSTAGPNDPWSLVLLDTQPAVRNARYAYVLVRYREDGEIASVHPIAPITAN